MPAAPSRGSRVVFSVAFGALLVLSMLPGSESIGRPGRTASAGSGIDLGHGLFTVTPVQQVSATPYWDNFNCPSQAQFRWCVDPVGVSYIAPATSMVLTEDRCSISCNGSRNALVEYYPDNGTFGSPLLLSCSPLNPYFPGVGDDYYVPCYNDSSGLDSILSIDYQTQTIAANFSDPAGLTTLTYDSSNGMLVAGGTTNLMVLNPETGAVVSTFHMSNASLTPEYFGVGGYTLVYDPLTDRLIFPSSGDQLIQLNLATGTFGKAIPLPAPAETLAIDPATDQLFAATLSASGVSGLSVFNARTYSLEARMTFPDCINHVCGSADVNQILVDPIHGDAYLVAVLALFTLNLSSLSLVGTTQDYGDGWQFSSAYLPNTDELVYVYEGGDEFNPGLLVQLHHTTTMELTSLLWLPPLIGLVVAVQLGGAGIAVVWVGLIGRRQRRIPGGPPGAGAPSP
jgi:hypothetical protein